MKRRKKSTKIFGKDEDSGRYIKCWHCGFVVNLDRTSAGYGHGNVHTVAPQPEMELYGTGDPVKVVMGIEWFNGLGVLIGTLSDKVVYKTVAKSGCPLCGCKNLP